MLHLTPDMLEALGARSQASFEQRMQAHLRRFFPARCEGVPDQKLAEFIRAAVDKARGYAIVRECDVAKFIDLMVALHPGFDTDPEMPWVQPLLTQADRPAEARLEAVYQGLLRQSGVRSF